MIKNIPKTIKVPLFILILLLFLFSVALAAPIDSAHRWAWSSNAGWINFRPTHGGVTVYDDHLEGYAWSENAGWIRLGTYTGGGSHTYANDAPTTYGVNNDGAGNLSGYAWGTNIGWVNFNPSHSQVTIDPATGEFNGYAWSENIGWIHFNNTSGFVYKTALAGSRVDTTDKWAWSTNGGWINFNPANGGMLVFIDHLEGDVWGENVGWIRLGTTNAGDPYTYANDASTTYGVNNDGCGNLSGYAWGTNVGWINFNPSDGQVTIDPVTGEFDGYAWGENVGWIHFKKDNPVAYNVVVGSMGNLTSYQTDPAAIITSRTPGPSSSSGLTISNSTFLNDTGDCIVFGHNNAPFEGEVTDHLGSSSAVKRWARIWEFDVRDGSGTTGGNVTLTFDISDAGGGGSFSDTGTYFLLKRDSGSNGDFTDVPVVSTSVSGDQLTFTVDASNLGSEFTLGAGADSPTAVSLQSFSATNQPTTLILLSIFGILVLGLSSLWLRRRGNH